MEHVSALATETSFAGVLASLAGPELRWVDDGLGDGLGDDVVALSQDGVAQGLESAAVELPDAGLAGRPLSKTEACEPVLSAADERKRASITIRVSAAEGVQLRARAAESGMTVSAYLRSCTLEVEGLRAQVKDAMARMRGAMDARKPVVAEGRSLRERIVRIWPHARDERRGRAGIRE